MSKKELRRIERFVKAHLAQGDFPVDLSLFYDLFEVKEVPFSESTYGFAFQYGRTRLIGINASLHPFQKRMVLAHEVSHCIMKHPNSLFLCEVNSWWYNKYEMGAQQGAALILLPIKPILSMIDNGTTVREVQDAFEAPADLVRIRLKMDGITVL